MKKTTQDAGDLGHAMKLELANAIRALATNESDPQTIRNRMAAAISGGYDFSDTMHNIFIDFGYPATVTFPQFWNMYRRFGIASRVCDILPDKGWTTSPIVKGSSQFDKELESVVKRTKLWQRLHALDKRQRVGRYAGLFMRVKDNKKPDQPIEGTLPSEMGLHSMVPLYEGQLKVMETETDPMSDDYGLPKLYEYSGGEVGNRNEKNANTFNIHPSRIIIAAEEADNGGIYGISALESCFNSLMDLRKIIGAGGEGFYRNAAQSLVHTLKESSNQSVDASLLKEMNEQVDDFLRNRMQRSIFTPGINSEVLQSNLANPKEFFMNALNDVSAACDVPATILIGQQTGRLASTEDGRQLLSTANTRRKNFQTEIVTNVIEWMQRYGILPATGFELEWDDLLALGDNEKLENSDKMASINEKLYKSGSTLAFTGEEIRAAAGYEPIEESGDLDNEELPDVDLDEEGTDEEEAAE